MSQEINPSSPSKRAFRTFFKPSSANQSNTSDGSSSSDRSTGHRIKVHKGSPVWGSRASDRSSTTPPPSSPSSTKNATSTAPFFQKRGQKRQQKLPISQPKKTSRPSSPAPSFPPPQPSPARSPRPSVPEPLWPDKDWFQGGHIGVDTHRERDDFDFGNRRSSRNYAECIMDANDVEFFTQRAEKRTSSSKQQSPQSPKRRPISATQIERFMHHVYPHGMKSPACQSLYASIFTTTSSSTSARRSQKNMLWNEKYRPCCVQQLLGNRDDHTYLRDWLHQMKVMSPTALEQLKQQKSNRKSTRKDLFENIPMGDEGDDDFMPTKRHRVKSNKPVAEQPIQSNLLLMVGKPGTGKTASVYTAAEEAGYEVFEIHPGLRRSGKDLTSSVGEMTESHLVAFDGKSADVTSRDPSPKPSKASVDFFRQFVKKKEEQMPTPPSSQPVHEHQQQAVVDLTSDEPTQPQEPKQSLVLLEEVDNLYEDDKGFWPAVVELAQKSKRPIILTCNDINVVPIEQLFLQAVLMLKPPKKDELLAYLQLVCFAEGYLVHPADLAGLFAAIGYDMRQLMMTLQLWCIRQTAKNDEDEDEEKEEDRPDKELPKRDKEYQEESTTTAAISTTSCIYHECPRLFEDYTGIGGHFSRPECLAQLFHLEQPRSKTGLDLVEFYEYYSRGSHVNIEDDDHEDVDGLDTVLSALEAVTCLDRKEGQEHECDEYGPSSADRPTGYKALWKTPSNTDHLFWDYGDSMATQTWVANYERLKDKDWIMATLWEQLLDVRSEAAGDCIAACEALLTLRTAGLSDELILNDYLPHIRSMCIYDQGVASRGRSLRTRRKRRYFDLSEDQRQVLQDPPRYNDATKSWCESLESIFTMHLEEWL
ncbi:hypothetical protein O0I10_005992 [Lichtheimia ornata]|uniref:AAA+ ATPase domain-containing protein n=1 Tax=Lichtheimia ornata TaxID=688661 RepID=A0AAD7XV87_9FUNG|nr:uncharacterized protein O0I10_005992 [Lichtheimia ornata]KAJ8658309.1 hypothetical protein O0I10_005992 [Lichtheimia ornata]